MDTRDLEEYDESEESDESDEYMFDDDEYYLDGGDDVDADMMASRQVDALPCNGKDKLNDGEVVSIETPRAGVGVHTTRNHVHRSPVGNPLESSIEFVVVNGNNVKTVVVAISEEGGNNRICLR